MLRYHPRADSTNPQGKKHKPANQRATPPKLHHAIEHAFFTGMELFAGPLNCSVEPEITYSSVFLEDAAFVALHYAFNYR